MMRYRVVVTTVISALFFCLIMVSASLAPFPYSGKNEFNSLGMWMNIGMILFFYILSLVLYVAGAKGVKFMMAMFCGVGILIAFTVLIISFVAGGLSYMSDFLGVILFCTLALITNIIWYTVVFKKEGGERYATF